MPCLDLPQSLLPLCATLDGSLEGGRAAVTRCSVGSTVQMTSLGVPCHLSNSAFQVKFAVTMKQSIGVVASVPSTQAALLGFRW